MQSWGFRWRFSIIDWLTKLWFSARITEITPFYFGYTAILKPKRREQRTASLIDTNHFITPNGTTDNWFRYKKKNKVAIGEVMPRFSNDESILIIHNSSLDMPQSSTMRPSEYHCPASSGLLACSRRWGYQTARVEPGGRGWSQGLRSPGLVVRPDICPTGSWWLTEPLNLDMHNLYDLFRLLPGSAVSCDEAIRL